MFSIGRIPVLNLSLLALPVAFVLLVTASATNAEDPQKIDAPLSTAKPIVPVAEIQWSAPPGHVIDRQLVQRLARFQEAARGPWPDDFNWNDLLEQVHAEILASAQDTLVTPATPGSVEDDVPRPYQLTPRILRSLKGVTEEIIAGLPPAGREAWLRLISDRADAEFTEASRSGRWDVIRRIASQDVHSPAGHKAIELLANRHLDQNRPLAALRQFHRLLSSQSARREREPLLSIRAAAAWNCLGRPDQARLSLIDLTQWLKEHPGKQTTVLNRAIPNAAEVSRWLGDALPIESASRDIVGPDRFASGGMLLQASTPAFSPDAQVLWTSKTLGFNVQITDEDRARFRFGGNDDLNRADPYPESEAETAALVELGMEHLAQRDRQRKEIAVPACEPVVINGRVVFRTLNRIRSVDMNTGQLQWESFLDDPAFAEQFDLRNARRSVNIPHEQNDILSPLNQRQSAVVYSRSRYDRTAGTLSTDGNVLFALEDGGITARNTSYNQPGLRHAAPGSSNRLCAFDLDTGSLRWQIGGPEGEHSLPAAGMFFLGVPTVHEDSIYVLGEQASLVTLLCLEPETGTIQWEQPIAPVNAAVDTEGLRRIGGISPRSADGLIICPSICGLVVAFDPEQKRLAWTKHYRTKLVARTVSRRVIQGPTRIDTDEVESTDRWLRDSTFVLAGRIIMAPLDCSELLCLDAVTGDTLWTQQRGQGLFVGAAYEDRVIVVDRSAVRALSLDDGKLLWDVSLNQRIPTGRGLRTGSLFHLPIAVVSPDDPVPVNIADPDVRASTDNAAVGNEPPTLSGRLITIDLKTGRLLVESDTPDGLPLGNIVANEGHLLTQRYDSVLAMESLAAVESQLARRLEQEPANSDALESRARIRLHAGRLKEGLDDLQLAVQSTATQSALDLLVDQSLEQLRTGRELNDRTKAVLATARLNATQRNSIDSIRSNRLVDDGSFTDAFEILLQTPQTDSETGQAFLVHDDPLTLSSTAWIAARLRSVYEEARHDPAATEQVKKLDRVISEQLDQARSAPEPDALRHWLSRFTWHSLSTDARVALAQRLDPDQDGRKIDSLWATLASSTDQSIAATAQSNLPKTGIAAAWPMAAPQVTTDEHKLNAARRFQVDMSGECSPALQGWSFQVNINGVVALDPTGNERWTLTDQDLGSAPLMTTSRHNGSRIFSSGHLLAVSTGTEFSVFDIHSGNPKRLWLRRLVEPDAPGFFQMRRTHLLGSSVLISGSEPVGSVDFLNSHSLVYRTGTTLRVVDALTGETIWTRDRIASDALIFGDEHVLSVATISNAHCQLFNIRTGRLIIEHFEIPLVGLLTTDGADPIVRQNRGTTHAMIRYDMRSGSPVWEYLLPNNSSIRPDNGNNLIELHPDGRILVHDVATGETVVDVQGEKLSSPGRFYLHQTPTEYVFFSASARPTFRSPVRQLSDQGSRQYKVEGPAYGIDRRTGKLIWQVNLEPQFLAIGQPEELPFVVLACQSQERLPNGGLSPVRRSYPVQVLDTRTGQTLFSSDDEQEILSYTSTGDASKKQASITYGQTIVNLDYSAAPQDSKSPKD